MKPPKDTGVDTIVDFPLFCLCQPSDARTRAERPACDLRVFWGQRQSLRHSSLRAPQRLEFDSA